MCSCFSLEQIRIVSIRNCLVILNVKITVLRKNRPLRKRRDSIGSGKDFISEGLWISLSRSFYLSLQPPQSRTGIYVHKSQFRKKTKYSTYKQIKNHEKENLRNSESSSFYVFLFFSPLSSKKSVNKILFELIPLSSLLVVRSSKF